MKPVERHDEERKIANKEKKRKNEKEKEVYK